MYWTISKRNSFILAILLTLAVFSGCSNRKGSEYGNSSDIGGTVQEQTRKPVPTPADGKETTEPAQVEADSIKQQIKKMALEEKIGQMVMVGVDDYTNNAHSRQMIEGYHVGGFILFKNNIRDTNQALGLINSLKETNIKYQAPLFFAVDEEGGRVTRMPADFNKIPAAGAIGKLNDSNLTFGIGQVIAKEIKALGFNMDFAPVLDINSNPKNPVIGDRAFGISPDIVTSLGIPAMKGIQSQNIISVVKHFPGHGDTSEDSHIGLPVVNNDMNRLNSFELIPFSGAVRNGADAVMIAHILLPKIDAENPASLSRTFITDILRGDLGFDGVIITDDMTMGAISKKYNIGDAAVKSVNAGSDIILVCHDYYNQTAIIDALNLAAKNGSIKEETIDKSVYRILKLKRKYGLRDEKIDSIDVSQVNRSINDVIGKLHLP